MSFQADALLLEQDAVLGPGPPSQAANCACEQSGIGISTMQEFMWKVDMRSESCVSENACLCCWMH